MGDVDTLTSLTSPTSKFFVSGPAPLESAGGPVTGVHGEEMVPAETTLPETTTISSIITTYCDHYLL
jgi:hypothetical protein